ncbi:MAG TPA: hypothetical protein VJ905_07665, partial [Halalkalibaculum sp.]|nr:hypothetical protein [Halalkalibaculum sp.]
MTLSGDIAGKIKKSNLWMLRESLQGDPFRQPADRDDCFYGMFSFLCSPYLLTDTMFTVKRGSGGIAGKTGVKALSVEEHNLSNDYS